MIDHRAERVFFDPKLHDIPSTAANGLRSAIQDVVPWMVSCHAAGGREMMRQMHQVAGAYRPAPIITAVLALSSDYYSPPSVVSGTTNATRTNAFEARYAGLNAFVAAGGDVQWLRRNMDSTTIVVAVGLRPYSGERHDQRRVLSPSGALSLGADYVVLGRAVTLSENPAAAALLDPYLWS